MHLGVSPAVRYNNRLDSSRKIAIALKMQGMGILSVTAGFVNYGNEAQNSRAGFLERYTRSRSIYVNAAKQVVFVTFQLQQY